MSHDVRLRRVTNEVVLVIFLGGVKFYERHKLGRDRLVENL